MNKFNGVQVFIFGLGSGYLDSGVVIIINSFLARHMYKMIDVSGQLLSIRLLFKNKLFVLILGLYTGASLAMCFFRQNKSHRCASFKKCLDLSLVNSLSGSSFSVAKTINYLFVFSNLVNTVVVCGMADVGNYFDTNHNTVYVFMDLGGLLDFKNAIAANAAVFLNEFVLAERFLNLDTMWDIVHKVMAFSANRTFKKKWFKDYNRIFIKESLKFYRLEILVSKIVKASHEIDLDQFIFLLKHWVSFDSVKASIVGDLVHSSANLNCVYLALCDARKFYHVSKLAELLWAKKLNIRLAVEKRMESFVVDKGHTIHSVLEHPFYKMVLDHLVSNGNLILDLVEIKEKVDKIMEGWTRKKVCQYLPLDYIDNSAFSGVMDAIGYNELLYMVKNLLDNKAANLSSIMNKLWKHCNSSVLSLLLILLNLCLVHESVPHLWKEAWVSMIPKLYEWEGVLTNTKPIALIKTVYKNFSKILSDRISLTCSMFDVLCGDNFSVLKGTTIQSLIFAIESVVEDALKKNHELWLMYKCFIRFFGSIHNDYVNCVMTDFGLTDRYQVHDGLVQSESLNVCGLDGVFKLGQYLFAINLDIINVYTNGSLGNLDFCKIKYGAAAYFSNLNLGIGIEISGLVSSTMAKLQAIVLALECVPLDSSVAVYLDSQTVLDACVAELALASLVFHNCVLDNEHIDVLAGLAAGFDLVLPVLIKEKYFKTNEMAVSSNIRHIVYKVFRSVNCAHWEVGPGSDVLILGCEVT
ncbi:hypothetical protein G9A89_016060 [Geosiphon pyriformis]|nr:hypothetical protein G9A89_016060 [Geosiphon pyriformis]